MKALSAAPRVVTEKPCPLAFNENRMIVDMVSVLNLILLSFGGWNFQDSGV